MIENVARAINNATCDDLGCDRDDGWQVYIPEAKAAIAAMTVQAEPVAWKNYADDGDWWLTDDREPADSCERSVPLYAQPSVPQSSDAEIAHMTEALRAAEERYQAAIDDVVAMIRVHVSEVADDNRYWGGPHRRAEWRASEVMSEITRRFGKDNDHG